MPLKPAIIDKDPYFSSVSLLLRMNGANGSTTFVDSGPNALAITRFGDAQISTAQSKYGGASAYFDGTGDYLRITDSTRFNFGSGDWTVEFWFYNSNPSDQWKGLIDLSDGNNGYAGIWVSYLSNNSIQTSISTTGFSWAVTATGTANSVSKNVWNHYAVVRTGNVVKIFLNGIQYVSNSTITGSVYAAKFNHFIGSFGAAGLNYNGYLDDIRITKGICRYIANFSPPAYEFLNI
jgi:hypothetical protein